MVPEPKREEHNGIDMFVLVQSHTFLAPLSDPIFGSEMVPEPKTGRQYFNRYVFVIAVPYIYGTPFGSDFWLRNGSGAQTEGE